MKLILIRWALIVFVLILAGCTMNIDAPQTPTFVVSPTLDETAVARLATKTPTPNHIPTATVTVTEEYTLAATLTAMPTVFSTASFTPSPPFTATNTSTLTLTVTKTLTPTQLATLTPRSTSTGTPTASATPSVVPTISQPYTATSTSTVMPTVTTLATPEIIHLVIPTATARSTATFTPFPTITPNLAQTLIAENLNPFFSMATHTPGGIYTLAPTATPPPTLTPAPVTPPDPASGTFYDPNAASGVQEALPVAPEGDSGPSGSPFPEQEYIVVSYEGQVVPILPLPDGIGTGAALASGDVFAVSGGGAVAAVGYDRWLYVNGQRMAVSPSSEFGLHPNLSIGDLVWSPDGQRLAFRVDTSNPSDFNGIDGGIWIYEPSTGRSWQVFRNTYQAAQLHEQRRALTVQWSPNGSALAVTVETGIGRGNVFLPVDNNANIMIPSLPFADATWTLGSSSLLVSGMHWDSQITVIGIVILDANWSYTEYLNQHSTGVAMQAAIQLHDGRIVFLGSSQGTFALYTMQAFVGAPTTRISQTIPGQIVAAEWNADRSAVLVTVQSGHGIRLWVIRTDGSARDTTPTAGAPATAHWR